MNTIIKFLKKYWIVISICATILSTCVTTGVHIFNKIDKLIDRITQLETDSKSYSDELNEQDQALDDHEKRLNKIETIKELWEKGLLKDSNND